MKTIWKKNTEDLYDSSRQHRDLYDSKEEYGCDEEGEGPLF